MTWVKWNLTSFCLDTMLVSVQDRCTVCVERAIGLKIILDIVDGTPRWRRSCGFSLLSHWRLLVSVQDRCTVCTKRTIGLEIILDALDGSPRWQGSSESLVRLEIVLILMQDRCTVCVECTIGTKIIFDVLDGTPRWRGLFGISFLFVWRQC
jgi:hypothetical protein